MLHSAVMSDPALLVDAYVRPGLIALAGVDPDLAQARIAELAASLAAESSLGFPTSAIAVIEFGGDWAQVAPGSGTLAGYWTPKKGSGVPGR